MKLKSLLLFFVLNAWLMGAAHADFYKGLDAARQGEHFLALKEWQPLAAEGHAPSQYNLGLMYENGLGVPPNPELALVWFKKSAVQGYALAQKKLAAMATN